MRDWSGSFLLNFKHLSIALRWAYGVSFDLSIIGKSWEKFIGFFRLKLKASNNFLYIYKRQKGRGCVIGQGAGLEGDLGS